MVVTTRWTVGPAIDYLREDKDLPDTFYELYVVDPGFRLVGSVALDRILRTQRAEKIASIMTSYEFEVLGVATHDSVIRTTVITSYTQHPSVVSRLTALPFRYVLNITEDPSSNVPVRVLIGQDHGA